MNLYKLAVSARAKMSAGHIYVKYNITLSILKKWHIFDKEKRLMLAWFLATVFSMLDSQQCQFIWIAKGKISPYFILFCKNPQYTVIGKPQLKTLTSFQTEKGAQGCFNYFILTKESWVLLWISHGTCQMKYHLKLRRKISLKYYLMDMFIVWYSDW